MSPKELGVALPSAVGESCASLVQQRDPAGTTVVALYADGGLVQSSPSTLGGTWAYCHVDAAGVRIATGSGLLRPIEAGREFVENNLMEYLAVVAGLEALPDGWAGSVCSDNKTALGRVFWDWKMNGVPYELVERGRTVIARLGACAPVLLDGGPTKAHLAAGVGKNGRPVSVHHVWCDAECNRLAHDYLVCP